MNSVLFDFYFCLLLSDSKSQRNELPSQLQLLWPGHLSKALKFLRGIPSYLTRVTSYSSTNQNQMISMQPFSGEHKESGKNVSSCINKIYNAHRYRELSFCHKLENPCWQLGWSFRQNVCSSTVINCSSQRQWYFLKVTKPWCMYIRVCGVVAELTTGGYFKELAVLNQSTWIWNSVSTFY